MSGTVGLVVQGALARVTLSHRAKFNAMSCAMWLQLRATFEAIQGDPNLRCVLVQGQAPADGGAAHFCAGGDISEYSAFRFEEASLRDFHENQVWGALQAMLDCDVPMVARIEGHCMGAGVEIASCCDLRLASEAARFGAPIARLGFPMAPREAALVLRALGELTAREMLLSAAVLEADEMQRRGFLNRVVPGDALDAETQALTERLLGLAPAAARMHKQALRALTQAAAAQATADLTATAYHYAPSPEHREGILAFVEKRAPRFHN
ncbi:MAG: enoyl-CoA hydratase/isomerase family protein [Rhodoferax sp.]